jgi:hypothetical protein
MKDRRAAYPKAGLTLLFRCLAFHNEDRFECSQMKAVTTGDRLQPWWTKERFAHSEAPAVNNWLCLLFGSSALVLLRPDFRKISLPYESAFSTNKGNSENGSFFVAPPDIPCDTFILVKGLDQGHLFREFQDLAVGNPKKLLDEDRRPSEIWGLFMETLSLNKDSTFALVYFSKELTYDLIFSENRHVVYPLPLPSG